MISAPDELRALPSVVEEPLEAVVGLAPASVQHGLDQARRRLEEERLNLVVLGEFKRGKRTLVNALLETEVVPTGVMRRNGFGSCSTGTPGASDPTSLPGSRRACAPTNASSQARSGRGCRRCRGRRRTRWHERRSGRLEVSKRLEELRHVGKRVDELASALATLPDEGASGSSVDPLADQKE